MRFNHLQTLTNTHYSIININGRGRDFVQYYTRCMCFVLLKFFTKFIGDVTYNIPFFNGVSRVKVAVKKLPFWKLFLFQFDKRSLVLERPEN